MQSKTTGYLKKRRIALAKKLAAIASMTLRGSLIERFKRCGKPRCKCANGQGHGPKYYLSVSQSGSRPKMKYVALQNKEVVQKYIENLQHARQLLEQINEINQELLRRREL